MAAEEMLVATRSPEISREQMYTRCMWRHMLAVRSCSMCLERHKSVNVTSQLITQYKVVEQSYKKKAMLFIDYKRATVSAGNGGNGRVSFLSLFANEFAGPDGGDGGNGAHIIFKADTNKKSLSHLKSQYTAESGEHGGTKNKFGKNGTHLVIKVPIGTVFKDDDFKVLSDLRSHDMMFIGARGGGGGKGNRFYMSAENTAPTAYEEGGEGQKRILHIELRVIAHAGLVGFPNAGKSTLLRAISKARPRVAAYPFTTLKPHIGILEYDDYEQVSVADIPGLISGAHLDRGLGISFLKHIERCLCLLYVIDLGHPNPIEQLDSLKFELEQYKEGLSKRPHAIVANKIDLPMAKDNLEKLKAEVGDMSIFPISAKHKMDTRPLISHIRELYDRHQEKKTS